MACDSQFGGPHLSAGLIRGMNCSRHTRIVALGVLIAVSIHYAVANPGLPRLVIGTLTVVGISLFASDAIAHVWRVLQDARVKLETDLEAMVGKPDDTIRNDQERRQSLAGALDLRHDRLVMVMMGRYGLSRAAATYAVNRRLSYVVDEVQMLEENFQLPSLATEDRTCR